MPETKRNEGWGVLSSSCFGLHFCWLAVQIGLILKIKFNVKKLLNIFPLYLVGSVMLQWGGEQKRNQPLLRESKGGQREAGSRTPLPPPRLSRPRSRLGGCVCRMSSRPKGILVKIGGWVEQRGVRVVFSRDVLSARAL